MSPYLSLAAALLLLSEISLRKISGVGTLYHCIIVLVMLLAAGRLAGRLLADSAQAFVALYPAVLRQTCFQIAGLDSKVSLEVGIPRR